MISCLPGSKICGIDGCTRIDESITEGGPMNVSIASGDASTTNRGLLGSAFNMSTRPAGWSLVGIMPNALTPTRGSSSPSKAAMERAVTAPRECPTRTIPFLPPEYPSYAFLTRAEYSGIESRTGDAVSGTGFPAYPTLLMFNTSKPASLKALGTLRFSQRDPLTAVSTHE